MRRDDEGGVHREITSHDPELPRAILRCHQDHRQHCRPRESPEEKEQFDRPDLAVVSGDEPDGRQGHCEG